MARRFNAVATNYFLSTARSPVTALPVTVACWANPIESEFSRALVSIQVASTGNAKLLCTYNSAATEFRVSSVNSSNTAATAATAGVIPNKWNHLAGIFLSSTSRTAYVNGVAGTTNTTSNDATPASLVEVALGARRATATYGINFLGDIADVAIWNIALTTREIQLLATGVSPLQIQASNLVAYWPLNGQVGSGEASLISRLDYATQFGTNPIVSDPLEALRNKAKSILPSFLIPSVTIPTLSSPTVINVTQTSATPRVTLTF